MIPAHENAECLTDIMARVEQLALASAEERNPLQPPSLPPEQGSLVLDIPVALVPTQPEYIQAEAFLEMSGFFTPSSKRIKNIYVKEKKLREYVDEQGKKRILKVAIHANHTWGLPITSDLDYYRAFLKICDETVDSEGRFSRMPMMVPTSTIIRYAGKTENARVWREVREWFDRMTGTLMKGAIYRAKKKDFDEGFTGTLFSQVVTKGELMRNGKVADTNYVWLSPWFLSNYYHRYLRPIDFEFYKRLRKPIAKSLYTLLENGWYAADGKPYTKSYPALCEEFLLTPHTKFSYIKQQLDPSHRELQTVGFLETWSYRKNADGTAYLMIYYPGQKFFNDQQAKDARRQLAEQIDNWQSSSPSPQLDLIDRSSLLLADILDTCGDQKNTAAYLKIIKDYHEPFIRMALSETRQAHLEGRITKTRGAYFTDTLKRLSRHLATPNA
jgi:hypothetical protein